MFNHEKKYGISNLLEGIYTLFLPLVVQQIILSVLFLSNLYAQTKPGSNPVAIAIHGGAGTILKKNLTPELESEYRLKLEEVLKAGYTILQNGGASLDAVETAIKIMEDSPLFNAGKGAVFTSDATIELDASIMDGRTLQAGAVAGIKHIKNPISLARLVMEKSPHVMLTGSGAEEFAAQFNLERVSQYYFYTEKRWESLKNAKENTNKNLDKNPDSLKVKLSNRETGTVGVVALDKDGNLAAGTSTGGTTNKLPGRVGDSPIIGAGTYANNATCAVSCTGDGEYFIRLTVAHNVSALMAYKNLSLEEAANQIIIERLSEFGGKGGLIAIDKTGTVAMPFNTEGMYRGFINPRGELVIKIYKEE